MPGLAARPRAPVLGVPPPDTESCTDILDLTNYHLPDLSGVTINASLQTLDLTANRLCEIDPRILALTGLVSLCLRQNLLTDVSCLSTAACKGTLQDLEARDNQLKQMPDLSGFSMLTRLEFSYNELKGMEAVGGLPPGTPLIALYLAANKIPAITGLDALTGLTTLELGSNRIRQIEGLGSQALLAELWLGRNRITTIQGLAHLSRLRRLSLQSNRLESSAGLEHCTALEELYLSHNGIRAIQGLAGLSQLKILDISSNRIEKLEGLDGLTQLEDLWINDNCIPDLGDGFTAGLAPLAGSLTTIYLQGNPAAKDPAYKLRVMQLLPKLQQLDSNFI